MGLVKNKKTQKKAKKTFVPKVRQLLQPPEFRIAAFPEIPESLMDALSIIDEPDAQSDAKMTSNAQNASTVVLFSPDHAALGRLLADVATGLWRMKQKMLDGQGMPLDETRRAYRHLESTMDVLTEGGIEIQDPTGGIFDSGMRLKAIAFQPTPGLGRELVIETIKPTVFFKEALIQMGEVIVGVPLANEGNTELPPTGSKELTR